MQLLSLADLGPEAQRLVEELSYQSGRDYGSAIVVFAGITVALWIVAAWIGAQAVSKENASVGGAVQTGFLWTIGYAFALALGGSAFYFAKLRGSATMASLSLTIAGILVLYTALSAPMKVYRLPFFKAFGLALVALIVHLAGQIAVLKAMGDPLGLQKRFDQIRRVAALSTEDAAKVLTAARKPVVAAVAPPPAPQTTPPVKPVVERPSPPPPKPAGKSIAERHDELKKVYADLMARREALREGDDAGLAAYTRETARYVEQLAQLQKDSDALKK